MQRNIKYFFTCQFLTNSVNISDRYPVCLSSAILYIQPRYGSSCFIRFCLAICLCLPVSNRLRFDGFNTNMGLLPAQAVWILHQTYVLEGSAYLFYVCFFSQVLIWLVPLSGGSTSIPTSLELVHTFLSYFPASWAIIYVIAGLMAILYVHFFHPTLIRLLGAFTYDTCSTFFAVVSCEFNFSLSFVCCHEGLYLLTIRLCLWKNTPPSCFISINILT